MGATRNFLGRGSFGWKWQWESELHVDNMSYGRQPVSPKEICEF